MALPSLDIGVSIDAAAASLHGRVAYKQHRTCTKSGTVTAAQDGGAGDGRGSAGAHNAPANIAARYSGPPMRVLYDGVVFQNAYQRGVQHVFRELLPRLASGGVEPVLVLADTARAELPTHPGVRVVGPPLKAAGLLPRRLRRSVRASASRPRLKRLADSCDLFHSTYFTLPPRPMKTVLHVHDMIVERYAEYFSDRKAGEEIARKRRAIEAADWFITISDATARELEHFYPNARGRITTVHLGKEHLSVRRADSAERPPGTGDRPAVRYALFVGDRALYKNFATVLDAMDCEQWPGQVALVVVGAPFRGGEQFRVERLASPPRNRTITLAGRVDDAELGRLYTNAACVIVPSRCEGFGFPVLEGQAAGAPVVCSDIPVFREVCSGDSALFFPWHDPAALARAVGAALEPARRSALVSAAEVNLQRFGWDKCAAEVRAVYERLIGA